MSWLRVMSDELRRSRDPQSAARAAMSAHPENWEEWLHELLVREAKHRLRGMALEVERSVDHEPVAEAVIALADEAFALPSGRWVPWATATIADHLERAAWQRQLAGTCVKDAERHEEAARKIQEAGVACLAELGKAEKKTKTVPISPSPQDGQAMADPTPNRLSPARKTPRRRSTSGSRSTSAARPKIRANA